MPVKLNRLSGTTADGLGSSPFSSNGSKQKRNQVTVQRWPDGKDMYTRNGTLVGNEDWRPDPNTDDVKRLPNRYDTPQSRAVRGELTKK